MQTKGVLFVFSGPSGAGKNTIMHEVIAADLRLRQLPTMTTRAMREGEQEGREHEFVDEDEFRQRIVAKELIEWQIIHDKGVYGVPRRTVQRMIETGQAAVADVDVLGAMALKQEFGDYVVLIFVRPPDHATLQRRLQNRPDVKSETELETRLRRAEFELSFQHQYDYVIENRDNALEESVAETLEIIRQCLNEPQFHQAPLGWKADRLHYMATAVVVQAGDVLVHDHRLPETPVAADQMPFESLQAYLNEVFDDVVFLPSREHADKRSVDIGFEAPQLVRIVPQGNIITRDHVYILRPSAPLHDLPADWNLEPVDTVIQDNTLNTLLLEAMGKLQY